MILADSPYCPTGHLSADLHSKTRGAFFSLLLLKRRQNTVFPPLGTFLFWAQSLYLVVTYSMFQVSSHREGVVVLFGQTNEHTETLCFFFSTRQICNFFLHINGNTVKEKLAMYPDF
jgi:hypothetical protein